MTDAQLTAGRAALLQGASDTAIRTFRQAVEARPGDAESRYWLASALLQGGDADGADQALNDARTLHALAVAKGLGADLARASAEPAHAHALAVDLYGQGAVAMASVLWGMAIAGDHINPQVLMSYGLSLQHQGRIEEACGIFRAAADHFPSAAVHQFLIFPQVFREDGDRLHHLEARAWAERWAKAPPPARHANPPLAGRKLKVGYVAPSFAGSQLRQFVAPIFESHDPDAVEVTLYPAAGESEAGWPAWVRVEPIGGLEDAEAAALIRRQGVDVLVDGWGHTAGARLGVFAHKPAPVQVEWLNFVQTSGLSQMDYMLYPDAADPPAMEGLFAETVWPLGPVFMPFRPAEGRLPPAPTPARGAGRITFGSFNHPAKINDGVVAAWGAVLRNRPDARLLLKYRYFIDPVLQRTMQARFAAHGVAPERLAFEGHTAGEAYFRAFQAVDLMLDTWPAPGSTTSLEALSNGVPVLSMTGPKLTLGGYQARTILEACGLAELVTRSPEAFVARSLELTADVEGLDALRARVRPGLEGGPLCDGPAFTRALEAAFAEMFENWERRARPALASGA